MVNTESAAPGPSPGVMSGTVRKSARRVVYRQSAWRVHQFEITAASGDAVCLAAVLRVGGGLLLWLGAQRQPELGAVALGVPGAVGGAGAAGALASLLADAGGAGAAATGLARRLAAALARPVHVCCSVQLDRFTAPLVERGLVAEIKSRPECF